MRKHFLGNLRKHWGKKKKRKREKGKIPKNNLSLPPQKALRGPLTHSVRMNAKP